MLSNSLESESCVASARTLRYSPLTAAGWLLTLGTCCVVASACSPGSIGSAEPALTAVPSASDAGTKAIGNADASASTHGSSSVAAGSGATHTSGSSGNAAAAAAAAGTHSDNPTGNGIIMPAAGSTAGANDPSPMPGDTCATGFATADPVTPTVWLIVDGSSSMDQTFDAGRSRWQVLRSTLMDPGGVVDTLQSLVKFGMVIYSGGAADPAQCVKLVTVNPALNNLANLSGQYPSTPLGMGTPTDRALDYVVSDLPVVSQAMLDTRTDPIYVVLATDGQPNDMCGGSSSGGASSAEVEQRVIDITTRGTQSGMHMYVVSMAGSDTHLQNHLMQVAQATESKTPPYAPATQNDLIAALRKITGNASCQVALDGMVNVGRECAGTVTLNGTSLTCDDGDGWKLFDPRTVQLTGKACNDFTSKTGLVQARFPCDVFTPD